MRHDDTDTEARYIIERCTSSAEFLGHLLGTCRYLNMLDQSGGRLTDKQLSAAESFIRKLKLSYSPGAALHWMIDLIYVLGRTVSMYNENLNVAEALTIAMPAVVEEIICRKNKSSTAAEGLVSPPLLLLANRAIKAGS